METNETVIFWIIAAVALIAIIIGIIGWAGVINVSKEDPLWKEKQYDETLRLQIKHQQIRNKRKKEGENDNKN